MILYEIGALRAGQRSGKERRDRSRSALGGEEMFDQAFHPTRTLEKPLYTRNYKASFQSEDLGGDRNEGE